MQLRLALLAALAGSASALLVSPNSPCATQCGNVLGSTTGDDMVCDDVDYAGTLAGTVFESCIECELTSAYVSGNTSDLEYLLYNLRYHVSYCLFGLLNNTEAEDTPCITSTACGHLKPAFSFQNMSLATGPFDYCGSWIETDVPKCQSCLSAGDFDFQRNYVTILDAACKQQPAAGSTLSIQGTPFTTTPVNITTPSETPLYTYTPPNEAISLGGKVGIAIGSLVFLLSVAGFLIVCFGRRRRRAFLKTLEARRNAGKGVAPGYFASHGPGPGHNWSGAATHDGMFGTPMSQKPLRGWDDSTSPVTTEGGLTVNTATPIAAHGHLISPYLGPSPISPGHVGAFDRTNVFPRYVSPYNSQYNSPISASETTVHWPTMEAMQAMTAAHTASPPIPSVYASASASASASGSASASANAGEGSSQQWAAPAARSYNGMTLEEYERAAHERELAAIGIAVGGSTPSLRSRPSNVSHVSHVSGVSNVLGINTQSFAGQPTRPPPVQIHGEPSSPSSPSSLSSMSVTAGALWDQPVKAKVVTMRRASKNGSSRSAVETYELREIHTQSQTPEASTTVQPPHQPQHQPHHPQNQPQNQPLSSPLRFYPPPPSPKWQSPYL